MMTTLKEYWAYRYIDNKVFVQPKVKGSTKNIDNAYAREDILDVIESIQAKTILEARKIALKTFKELK